jgi:hypothetical protein
MQSSRGILVAMIGGGSGHSFDAEGLDWLRSQPRNGERERRPTGGRGWNRLRAGRRLQAAQTAGFTQKDGKANTVKHDVTEGVTNAVTESVTATPAVTVDHQVTAGVTEAVTDTVTPNWRSGMEPHTRRAIGSRQRRPTVSFRRTGKRSL